MNTPTLFIDRDGTLIEEPADHQVDALEKISFMPGVFAALSKLSRLGFRLVMVTNQDSLGTMRYPLEAFEQTQNFILRALGSQGIRFDAAFVCPHSSTEGCPCRKPKTGLVEAFVRERSLDLERSAVIGDRETDIEFAKNLGVKGFLIRADASSAETWMGVMQALIARRAEVTRYTSETRIIASVNLDATQPLSVETGIGFFDHMLTQLAKHGGFSLDLTCAGDLNVDEHHTVEDCALALGEALRQALGDKRGIGRYGFVLPMDEAQATIAIDLAGRAFAQFSGDFDREYVGGLPTELVPHFFRSLSESLGAAIHVEVKGENAHHMIEACFKGVGRSLRRAFRREGSELPSTKGTL